MMFTNIYNIHTISMNPGKDAGLKNISSVTVMPIIVTVMPIIVTIHDTLLLMTCNVQKLYIIIKTVTTVKQIPPMFEN